jgi:hypothetical protein
VAQKRYIPPPIQTAIVNAAGFVTGPWGIFFQQVGRPIIHENTLAKKPTNLRSEDEGILFHSTDYDRWWRWNGAAWERAPWELPTRFVGLFIEAPGTGWKLLDGTSNPITYTKADATTATFSPASALGDYIKLANAFGGHFAAIAALISGNTANAATGVTVPANSGVNSASQVVQSGTGVTVAAHTHTHPEGPVTDPQHLHAAGTLVNDLLGEPPHYELMPYVRL